MGIKVASIAAIAVAIIALCLSLYFVAAGWDQFQARTEVDPLALAQWGTTIFIAVLLQRVLSRHGAERDMLIEQVKDTLELLDEVLSKYEACCSAPGVATMDKVTELNVAHKGFSRQVTTLARLLTRCGRKHDTSMTAISLTRGKLKDASTLKLPAQQTAADQIAVESLHREMRELLLSLAVDIGRA